MTPIRVLRLKEKAIQKHFVFVPAMVLAACGAVDDQQASGSQKYNYYLEGLAVPLVLFCTGTDATPRADLAKDLYMKTLAVPAGTIASKEKMHSIGALVNSDINANCQCTYGEPDVTN